MDKHILEEAVRRVLSSKLKKEVTLEPKKMDRLEWESFETSVKHHIRSKLDEIKRERGR